MGSNGAGKTTVLRAVSGLVRPMAGRVRFMGRDITGLSPHTISHRSASSTSPREGASSQR
ncbi:MAG: ATP-binding cassette domain-containing protein [Betaproteobacteria bacterium]